MVIVRTTKDLDTMKKILLLSILLTTYACSNDDISNQEIDINTETTTDTNPVTSSFDFSSYFNIDFDNLSNYVTIPPAYITKDNTNGNEITNEGATLGRILFYDKNLSSNNTISCSSCHIQSTAFSDNALVSQGVNGTTARHSMRLINSRFADETNFFWDERASSLEEQTTMPIQDHAEMGFSGTNGDLNFDGLLNKLNETDYYPELFNWVYGESEITENKIQLALAQFIRSIQSFDSRYDTGRVSSPNDRAPFTNFSQNENNGKQLFLDRPNFDAGGNRTSGGVGCAACHRPPEFDIDPQSLNNGFIHRIATVITDTDFTVTRAPSLRDIFNPEGELNGPLMHFAVDLDQVIDHYNDIPNTSDNPQLDRRLKPGGNLQNLQMTAQEINDLKEFLLTLSGNDVYTNEKWANPFL